jgi:Tol biopolymer transport system component
VTPERYRQIDALAEAALAMSGPERNDFLQRACGSDQDLLQRVSQLVRSHESPAGFLEAPAFEAWARDVAASSGTRPLTGREVGRYLVLSHLGSGGIGDVWLAKDQELMREVALKLLSQELAGDSEYARRFRQEARAASALNHPNLVTVFDIGTFEGRQFIAQEYIPGKTLRDILREGPMKAEAAADMAAQVAAALSAAHGAGIVHRDIKPENIMIRPDGLVKVLDFGLARFLEAGEAGGLGKTNPALTRPGIILGTARYMSPEQARGLPADVRSDLFSLGVVLYELLAGTAPFTGETASDIMAAILKGTPAPLSRSVPAGFERIVRRCLEKDPAARYASADALKDDLTRLAARLRRPVERARHWRIGAAACAALAAIAAGLFWNARTPPPPFNAMQITRLATRGEAVDAAISHDGKFLAYVRNEASGQSLWVRPSSGADESAAVPVEAGEHSGVVFSPDDSLLYYRRRGAGTIGDLYRVPVNGGVPERLIGEVSGPAAISPDGRHIAFVRLKASSWEASLIVANADGIGESTLATLRRPRYFDEHSVAWSPDGRAVACFAGQAARYSEAAFHLVEVRLDDRRQRVITEQSWAWPRSLAWSAKGDVLIVTAASRGNDVFQLWMVGREHGGVTRLTNDLSSYDRVTLTGDGKSLATVQRESSAAIWVGPGGDAARSVRITRTPLRSSKVSIAWTPQGGMVYSDPTGDSLWSVDSHGGNPRRLAPGPGNKDQIVMTRDGRYIVYLRAGNIWRMDADGTHARQLTHGPLDVHPDVSADGRWVVYASFADWSPGVGGEPTLWKVPIDGGEAVEISREPASYPRVSPDGLRLGCVYFPGRDPRFSAGRVAVLGLDGSSGLRIFESSPRDETALSWSSDGKALDYIVDAGGTGNIWRQPSGGGPATRLTGFDGDELFAFAWSPEGRLACVRGGTARGVVLIENFH